MHRLMFKTFSKIKGFTLPEVVVYVGIFSMIMLVLMGALKTTLGVYTDLRLSRDVNDSAVKILERLSRDTRAGRSIDLSASIFNATSSQLQMKVADTSGTVMTVRYVVIPDTDGVRRLHVYQNGTDLGVLNAGRAGIEAFVLRYVEAGGVQGVKTELYLKGMRSSNQVVQERFYGMNMLRGSY